MRLRLLAVAVLLIIVASQAVATPAGQQQYIVKTKHLIAAKTIIPIARASISSVLRCRRVCAAMNSGSPEDSEHHGIALGPQLGAEQEVVGAGGSWFLAERGLAAQWPYGNSAMPSRVFLNFLTRRSSSAAWKVAFLMSMPMASMVIVSICGLILREKREKKKRDASASVPHVVLSL